MKKNFKVLLNENEYVQDEIHRRELLKKGKRITTEATHRYLKNYVDALQLSDEISFHLRLHPDCLPTDTARLLHVRFAQEYFLSQTHMNSKRMGKSWFVSLDPFCVQHEREIRQSLLREVSAVFESELRSTGSGQKPFDAGLLFKGICYCMSRIGQCDRSLVFPIHVSWKIHFLLLVDEMQMISAAVNQEFSWAGARGMTHKDLHWCVCQVHIQLKRDMRFANLGHEFQTESLEQKNMLVGCAESAIQCRPDLPRGYCILDQVQQDLAHVDNHADRYHSSLYAKGPRGC